jgi:hypothetical protein
LVLNKHSIVRNRFTGADGSDLILLHKVAGMAFSELAAEPPPNRRNSCLDAFKKLSKSAWRRFGGFSRESRANAIVACEPPIETLVVDENDENISPLEAQPFGRYENVVYIGVQSGGHLLTSCSASLEVDPNETTAFAFPTDLANAPNNERLSSLYARYGLLYDADGLRPTPYSNAPSARLRVPKRIRLRVRIACHVCNSIFKGERECTKCGHRRCGDCKRQSLTGPRLSIDKADVIVVDEENQSSDDGKSVASSRGSRFMASINSRT